MCDKHKFGSTGSCKMKRRPIEFRQAEESEKCFELSQIRHIWKQKRRKNEIVNRWIHESKSRRRQAKEGERLNTLFRI